MIVCLYCNGTGFDESPEKFPGDWECMGSCCDCYHDNDEECILAGDKYGKDPDRHKGDVERLHT